MEIDEEFSSENKFFGYFDTWISESLQVSRPAYFVFAKDTLFVDFPFCKMSETGDLLAEFGPWGLGRSYSALTYHNVFAYGPLLADPDGTLHLLRMIASMAAEREFSILGERKFVKKTSESKETPETNADTNVAKNLSAMNRDAIDKQYGIALTDNQWRIIQAEITDKDDWEDTDEIIQDVCQNLASYEQEYAWWEDKVAQAQANKNKN